MVSLPVELPIGIEPATDSVFPSNERTLVIRFSGKQFVEMFCSHAGDSLSAHRIVRLDTNAQRWALVTDTSYAQWRFKGFFRIPADLLWPNQAIPTVWRKNRLF
jgi:hypothetical protein